MHMSRGMYVHVYVYTHICIFQLEDFYSFYTYVYLFFKTNGLIVHGQVT